MTYKCSKEIPICEFYNNGECINMEDCAHAIAVVIKPLADWTLREVKAECAKQISCYIPNKCPFCLDSGDCRLSWKPLAFKLSEEDYK